MQAAATCFLQPLLPLKTHSNRNAIFPKLTGERKTSRPGPLRVASVASESSTVDYNSAFSVFPAEACETVGGDCCAADMYPEARLAPQPRKEVRCASEGVDREYFDYNSESKSVLKGEACDDLGGEFCKDPYMMGVY